MQTKGHFQFILIFFILFGINTCSDNQKIPPKAINGVLDLRTWDFERDGKIKLDGEWVFYWNQFIEHSDAQNEKIKPDITFNLPNTWNGTKIQGEEIGADGYCTLVLKVLLPTDGKSKSLAIVSLEQATAYRIFINDRNVAEQGRIGKNKEESIPNTVASLGNFSAENEFQIYLQISNFHHRKGGVWHSLYLGRSDSTQNDFIREKNIDVFVSGIILIIALYHFVLHLINKSDKIAFSFFLLCVVFFLRNVTTGQKTLLDFFPGIPFRVYVLLEYISMFFILPVAIQYLKKLYPNVFSNIVLKIYYGIAIGLSLFCIVTPVKIFSHSAMAFQIVSLTCIFYVIYKIIYLIFKGYKYSIWLAFGFGFLSLAGVNDILFAREIIRTGFFSPYALIVLIFTQAIVLAHKFSQLFIRNELLVASSSLFVPTNFISLLGKNDITQLKFGDKIEKKLSVLFSDIRNFTNLSENMSVDENFNFINSYLKVMGPIIRESHGFIDKYIGDSIMALFPDEVESSINAALNMQEKLIEYNQNRKKSNYSPIEIGIGIHYGNLMLGTIGEAERMEGTVISDNVNLASRLEGLTKIYGCSIIISEAMLQNMKNAEAFKFRMLDTIRVKGKNNSVSIYQIFTRVELDMYHDFEKIKSLYENGLQLYRAREFSKAIAVFTEILNIVPTDKPSKVILDKCNIMSKQNLSDDWDAITTLMEK